MPNGRGSSRCYRTGRRGGAGGGGITDRCLMRSRSSTHRDTVGGPAQVFRVVEGHPQPAADLCRRRHLRGCSPPCWPRQIPRATWTRPAAVDSTIVRAYQHTAWARLKGLLAASRTIMPKDGLAAAWQQRSTSPPTVAADHSPASSPRARQVTYLPSSGSWHGSEYPDRSADHGRHRMRSWPTKPTHRARAANTCGAAGFGR